jgi:hypothetical protein
VAVASEGRLAIWSNGRVGEVLILEGVLQFREAQVERLIVDTVRMERHVANLRDLFADTDIS